MTNDRETPTIKVTLASTNVFQQPVNITHSLRRLAQEVAHLPILIPTILMRPRTIDLERERDVG
jgi:hypothetical protein